MSDDIVLSLLNEAVSELGDAHTSISDAMNWAEDGQSELELLSSEVRLLHAKAVSLRDKWLPNYNEKIDAMRDDAADAKRDEAI